MTTSCTHPIAIAFRVFLFVAACAVAAPRATAAEADFRLQDHIGRSGRTSASPSSLTAGQLRMRRRPCADRPGGCRYRINSSRQGNRRNADRVPGRPGCIRDQRISFLTRRSRRRRVSMRRRPVRRSDLKVEEMPDLITLSNSKTGIRLARMTRIGESGRALCGVRLASGAWQAGPGCCRRPVRGGDRHKILARGPVFARLAAGFAWRRDDLAGDGSPGRERAGHPDRRDDFGGTGVWRGRRRCGWTWAGFDPDACFSAAAKATCIATTSPHRGGRGLCLEPCCTGGIRIARGTAAASSARTAGPAQLAARRPASGRAVHQLKHAPQGNDPPDPPRPPHSPGS